MSRKKKTDLIKIVIGAVFAAASVLFVWMLKNPQFGNIPPVLITAAIIAFIAELIVLKVFKSKKAIIRAIKITLLFIINISVFSSSVIYSFAPAVILQPHTDEISYEALKSVQNAEEISFKGENGNINGWFYNNEGDSSPTVLYFCGNYETAATSLFNLINSGKTAFSGCNFAVFDYPSYGKSEGRCNDKSILSFALDVYDELSKRTDDIIVLGYSLGTGAATYLASEREVKSLILYAPYADTADLYNNVIDIFHGPLEWLVSFDIESEKYALHVTEKTLIIASEADELIPFASSKKLSEKLINAEIIKAPSIGHNDFFSSAFVREVTESFIKEVNE